MELVNVIDFQKSSRIWGNIKSHISKLAISNNKHEVVLKLENNYGSTNYSRDTLPENLKETLDEFPENLDLKYTIFKNETVHSRGFLKEFKNNIHAENNLNTPQVESFQSPVSKMQSNSGIDNPLPNQTNQQIDVDKFIRKFSEIQELNFQNHFKDQQNYLEEKFAQYIKTVPVPTRPEKYSEEFVNRLQKKNQDLEDELKEVKRELKDSNNTLLSAQRENVKLSTQLELILNDTTENSKLKSVLNENKNLLIKIDEMEEDYKEDLLKLDMEIKLKRLEVESLKVKNETRVDRGLDFLAT